MAHEVNPGTNTPSRWRLPRPIFWVQLSACAVVAWSLLHGGISLAPPDEDSPVPPPPLGASAPHVPVAPLAAAVPALKSAEAALSSIDVTVARNDTLDRSLFEAVSAAGAHEQTAVALADIFGWDIDFVLDVRPGDAFVVTYPEIYRDGVYIKDGPIQAAEFVNQGHDYKAVRYTDPEGSSHYYTPDGKSMHKAFLRAPLEFSRVSSRFNSARYHPILNLIRAHKGVDYAAPVGTPVRAAGDGRVRFAGRKGGYGNVVEIEHSASIVTVYGHLSRFAHVTHVGAHVTQGVVIAYVGMTGLATGPHLHYEYRVNGAFKNPQTVILPGANPIEARWREDFLAKTQPLLASLEPVQGPMLVSR